MKRGILSLTVGAIVALILLGWWITFTVAENQVAVLYRFGRFEAAVDETGLHWKWPSPIQTVTTLDMRIQITEGAYKQGMTKDSITLIPSIAFGWTPDPENPELFVAKNKDGDYLQAEENLRSRVNNAWQATLAKYTLDEIITTENRDRQRETFADIERDLERELNKVTLEDFGIRVAFARLRALNYPKEVSAKVEEYMIKERKAVAEKIVNAGINEANKIVSEAEAQRGVIIGQAEKRAIEIRTAGDAQAAEYYNVIENREMSQLAVFFDQLEALSKMKERTTLVLDTRTPPFNLLAPVFDDIIDDAAREAGADNEAADE